MIPLVALFVGTGTLLTILAIPLVQRRIKPNMWYGFRTKSTLSNSDLWYDANAYSGRLLLLYGIAIVVAAVLVALIPNINLDIYSVAMLVVTMIGLLIIVVLCWNFLRTYSNRDITPL